jgi:hypothetical protein
MQPHGTPPHLALRIADLVQNMLTGRGSPRSLSPIKHLRGENLDRFAGYEEHTQNTAAGGPKGYISI